MITKFGSEQLSRIFVGNPVVSGVISRAQLAPLYAVYSAGAVNVGAILSNKVKEPLAVTVQPDTLSVKIAL